MDVLKDLTLLIGRICISALFLWAAMEKLFDWKGTADYMKLKKVPRIPLVLPAVALFQILGGLSLLLGFHIRWGALLLILFIVPAAVRFHDFWNREGAERVAEKTFFMKDVAIFGSLLLILVWGGGRFSMTGG